MSPEHPLSRTVAELGDFLRFQSPRRINCSTSVREAGGEDVVALGTGETAPEDIRLLKETEGIRSGIEGRQKLGVGSLCSMHIELYTRGAKTMCTSHREVEGGREHRTADARDRGGDEKMRAGGKGRRGGTTQKGSRRA